MVNYAGLYDLIVGLIVLIKDAWQPDTAEFNALHRAIQFGVEPLSQTEAASLSKDVIIVIQTLVFIGLLPADGRSHYVQHSHRVASIIELRLNYIDYRIEIGSWTDNWDQIFNWCMTTVFCLPSEALSLREWTDRMHTQIQQDANMASRMQQQLHVIQTAVKTTQWDALSANDYSVLISCLPVAVMAQFFELIQPHFSTIIQFKPLNQATITDQIHLIRLFFEQNHTHTITQACYAIIQQHAQKPAVKPSILNQIDQTLDRLLTPTLGLYTLCNRALSRINEPLNIAL